jgi:hypothetical protein
MAYTGDGFDFIREVSALEPESDIHLNVSPRNLEAIPPMKGIPR